MSEETKSKILYIDDEEASLIGFKSIFRDKYEVYTAKSAEEGYNIMHKMTIDLVISDQRMPGITGVEFLQKIRVEYPETVRMLITGYSDIDAVIKSINGSMITYYFTKPYEENDMRLILDNSLEKKKLIRQNQELYDKLQQLVLDLEKKQEVLKAEIVRRQEVEQELLLSRDKAEESSRLKSSLLSNLNHEFRTPMNSILGFSELMKVTESIEAIRSMAVMINTSGKRLLKTLNSIVDLAIFEADKKPPDMEWINLSEVVEQVTNDFRDLAKRKNLIVEINASSGVMTRFNRSFVSIIITNLIDNAIKFTRQGSVQIKVNKETKGNSEIAVFQVCDTGIGIAPEFHTQVFDDFRQVSEGQGRYYEGLGIGLSLCKRILTRLQGEISLHSIPDQGTTFTVRFPEIMTTDFQAEPNGHETWEMKESVPAVVTPEEQKPITTALVVEDNEYNVELIEMYLEDAFRIEKAYSGESAVRMAQEKYYDVILMDINLGAGIDGVETLKRIREFEINATIPVIAVTGYTSMEDKKRLFAEGFNAFLPKPFTRTILLSSISKVLDK